MSITDLPAAPSAKAPVPTETRSYDPVGNLLTKSKPSEIRGCCSQDYSYDGRNRMVAAQSAQAGPVRFSSYGYNGRGERVWRDAGNKPTLYAYDESGRLLGEYSSLGAAISEVVWLDDLPVGVIRGATAYPVEADHLGSPRVVGQSNSVLWKWDLFGPVFGEGAPNEDVDGNGTAFRFDLRFPGQQWDATTGLHYNYFRDYEAGVGRYVESDPIGLRGGISTYAYARSVPAKFSDRLGTEASEGTGFPICNNGSGTTVCDGNGGFRIVICNAGCTGPCTRAHEEQHLTDFWTTYPNSCQNKAAWESPDITWLQWRDIECRGHAEGIACAKKLDEKCCPEKIPYIEASENWRKQFSCHLVLDP